MSSSLSNVLIQERNGSLLHQYAIRETNIELTSHSNRNLFQWRVFRQTIRSIFLPEGYPDSVSKDYWNYQKWDSLQALCSSVTGLLSTQAVLKGVGVGEATATPAAAAIQWVIRDGTGMVSRIAFAWAQGTNLDSNAKTWRIVADILNDLALLLELLSPMFPSFFLIIVCFASTARSIVGVAGGASRAAITQHQARKNNLGDVCAKDGSQETAVALTGMILGVIITPLIQGNVAATWGLFFLFTFLHLFANYNAVSSVEFDTMNQQRASILISSFLDNKTRMLTPHQVALKERFLTWENKHMKLIFGGKISDVCASQSAAQFVTVLKTFDKQNYVVTYCKNTIVIIFHEKATPCDMLKAFFQSEIIRHYVSTKLHIEQNRGLGGLMAKEDMVLAESFAFVEKHFEQFVNLCELAGWNVNLNLLGASEWRVNWQTLHEE